MTRRLVLRGAGAAALCWPATRGVLGALADESALGTDAYRAMDAGASVDSPLLPLAAPLPIEESLPPDVIGTGGWGEQFLVCVHGICCHKRGFSRCWWRALKPHLPEIADDHVLEVNWSDLAGRCPGPRHRQVDELPDYIQVGANCLNDIPDYLLKSDVRQAILHRFWSVVKPRLCRGATLHVIGHSWGSLISYEGLRLLDCEPLPGRVGTLFAVGSPLWIKFVRKHLAEHGLARCKPALVDCWVSVEGCRDVFARSLAPYYNLDAEYLNTPAVGCAGVYGLRPRMRFQRSLCPHFSYFRCANAAVNRDIFAAHIRQSIAAPIVAPA